ncbi:MAG: hypothetical protein EU548_05665 [Promethearchaeota archaeon]|nr:MAG: hypothetical protein EU548_05665 [Candidatus Lokiarchaeota archaeon]
MDNEMEKLKDLESDILKIIKKEFEENSSILGITIGTHGGTLIANKVKKSTRLTENEITAATSSLLFLSSKMLKSALNQEISYNLIAGKEKLILSILTKNIIMVTYLKRELAELEGTSQYIKKLKKLALKISAIVETSDLIKEEVFVSLKRAIPNALIIAIITKEGMPIKVQSTMSEPMLSAMVSALYKLSQILLETGGLEYSLIGGENGSIIVHELDNTRILCIAVPEADDTKLGAYVAKIKSLIE